MADGHAIRGGGDRVAEQQRVFEQQRDVPEHAAGCARHLQECLPEKMPQGDVVAARRKSRNGAEQRTGTVCGEHESERRCGRNRPTDECNDDQRHRKRCNERPAQVVDDLPDVDRTKAEAAGVDQERQQLPVAAGPSPHARGRNVCVQRGIFDQRDVADAAAAGDRPFDQVVAEHLSFGQTAGQYRVHCLDVQQTLSGKRAFFEQILIHLRRRHAVWIDAALPREQPVKRCRAIVCRQRRRDAWLQDSVTGHDPSTGGVDAGLVHRVCRDADEFAQCSRCKHRIAVERDDICRSWSWPRAFAQVDERRCARRCQQCDQLFEFSAFALPTDPALFRFGPTAFAMQQQKSAWRVRGRRIAGFERVDCVDGCGKQHGVVFAMRRGGVRVVAQQRKLCVVFCVGEVVALQLARQRANVGGARQHSRNDDQYPVFDRYPVRQRKARQTSRQHRLADQTMHDCDHGFARRPHGQQCKEQRRPGRLRVMADEP